MAKKSRFALTPLRFIAHIFACIYLAAAFFIPRQTLSVFLSSVCFSSSKQCSTCVALLPTCILHSSFLYLTSDCLASFSSPSPSPTYLVTPGLGKAKPPEISPPVFFYPGHLGISGGHLAGFKNWQETLVFSLGLRRRRPPVSPACIGGKRRRCLCQERLEICFSSLLLFTRDSRERGRNLRRNRLPPFPSPQNAAIYPRPRKGYPF